MKTVVETMAKHYAEKFERHGATPQGLDWGPQPERLALRYDKMLAVIAAGLGKTPSLLDVGCGYGGLLEHARAHQIDLEYTGIDLTVAAIDWARANHDGGIFRQGDVLATDELGTFDYVVCNGILTLKLDLNRRSMDAFAHSMIRRMFSLAKIGIAFNNMTDRVNFHNDNLYYRSPLDMLAWCQSEISPHVKLDHAYPLHEYTIYVYREPV